MSSLKNPAQQLRHALGAFKWASHGLWHTLRAETAFLQEAIALAVLPVLAWLLGCSAGHIFLIIAAWLAVMLVELLNTALENICNLVSPEYNILVKRAKDAGAAAVLLALFANGFFWAYLLYAYW